MRQKGWQLCEAAAKLAIGVVRKAGHVVWGGVERERLATVCSRIVLVQHVDDGGRVGLLHAGEQFIVASGRAANLRSDISKVRVCWVVGRSAGSCARLCNEAFDDWVLGVCVGILVYCHASCGLTEQDHAVWIAAESLDVVVHPLDCFTVVEQTGIEIPAIQCSGIGVSEDIETVAAPVSEKSIA